LLLPVRFAARDVFRPTFADFDFDLFVAILISLGQEQQHVLPLTRPRRRGGAGKKRQYRYSCPSRFSSEAAS
jgi:hypothetical protein